MQSLEKILEAERAAGFCALEATPSGKAMHDRVWARTLARIAKDSGEGGGATPGAAGQVLTWARRIILFAVLVLAASPSEEVRTVNASSLAVRDRSAPPSGAVVPGNVTMPIQTSTTVPTGIEAVSIEAMPAASSRNNPPSPAPGKITRAASLKAAVSSGRGPLRPVAMAPSPGESDQLDFERRLLDRARLALAAQDYAGAGAVLSTYETMFRDGQLGEEEQALKIRWLSASGDGAAACAMAARFKERFPTSLFRPAVETALRSASQEGTAP